MKKVIAVVVVLLVLVGETFAQDAITKFFNKYQNDENGKEFYVEEVVYI